MVCLLALTGSVASTGTESEARKSIEVSFSGANHVHGLNASQRDDRQRGNRQGGPIEFAEMQVSEAQLESGASFSNKSVGATPRNSVRATPRRSSVDVPPPFPCSDDWYRNIPPGWGGEVNGGCEPCFWNSVRDGGIIKLQQQPLQLARGGDRGSKYFCVYSEEEIQDKQLYMTCSDESRKFFYECEFPLNFFALEDQYRASHGTEEWMPFGFQCSGRCRAHYEPAGAPQHVHMSPVHMSPVRSEHFASDVGITWAGNATEKPFSEQNNCPAEKKCTNPEYIKVGPLKDGLFLPRCHCQPLYQKFFPFWYISLPLSVLPFLSSYVKKNFSST